MSKLSRWRVLLVGLAKRSRFRATVRTLCLILPCAALTLIAWTPLARADEARYITDSTSGCNVWNKFPEPNETVAWSGECRGGFASGSGVLQWVENGKPGERYVGEMDHGKLNGIGTQTRNGGTYEGEFRDSVRNGHGKEIWADGKTYEGGWLRGMPEGLGTLVLPPGKIYSGHFEHGCLFRGGRLVTVGDTTTQCLLHGYGSE